MPQKIYRFKYKVATVTVKGDNQKQARYNAELAYNYWHTQGKMPPAGSYNGARIEVRHD